MRPFERLRKETELFDDIDMRNAQGVGFWRGVISCGATIVVVSGLIWVYLNS